MISARDAWIRLSKRLKHAQTRPFCAPNTNNKPNSSGSKVESNGSNNLPEAYRQVDNLDFMTAAKILFTDPPKKKKFGFDFHLVQLFFACMPSLAVYLVAQYARYEMRRMEADLEEKKKKEEEKKAKEMEENATEEKEAARDPELLDVKVRLDKLEEAVKEIVVVSKKQSGSSITEIQEDSSEKKHLATTEPSNSHSISASVEKDQKVQKDGLSRSVPVTDASTSKGGVPSQDSKK